MCAVNSEILGKETLAGIKFQRDIEEKAYKLGGGNFTAPVQRLDDYINGRVSDKLGKIRPSYTPNYKFAALDGLKCAISILENKKYKNQSFFIKLKYKHEQSHQIITNVGAIFLIYINCQLLIKKKIPLAYNLLYQ